MNTLIFPSESFAMVSHSCLHGVRVFRSLCFVLTEQYDFFFKAWDEVYGDYTVSITAQLGEGSIGANWKLEIYDFADGGSEPWVSVGDLSGGELPLKLLHCCRTKIAQSSILTPLNLRYIGNIGTFVC